MTSTESKITVFKLSNARRYCLATALHGKCIVFHRILIFRKGSWFFHSGQVFFSEKKADPVYGTSKWNLWFQVKRNKQTNQFNCLLCKQGKEKEWLHILKAPVWKTNSVYQYLFNCMLDKTSKTTRCSFIFWGALITSW